MKKKLTLILAIIVVTVVSAMLLLFAAANNTLVVNTGDGITFDNLGLWLADKPLSEIPQTYEAWVYLPADWEGSEPGGVMGNYKGAGEQGFRFRLREADDGTIYPNLMYTVVEKVASNGNKQYISYNFTKAIVPTDQWVHIAITDDGTNGFKAYINGTLMQSAKQSADYAAINKNPYNEDYHYVIGAEQATGSNPFKGQIRSAVMYSDVRTADEIASDMNAIDLTDENLISAYNLNGRQNEATIIDAAGNYNITHGRRNADWATPEQMPSLEEYDYSIAIIGDTQAVNKYYPEYMGSYFDWILKNKDEHKIEHVLNLGDITNNNEDAEWERARDGFFSLNGIVDYTLVRGDHDILLSNNKGDADTSNDTLPGGDAAKYDRFFDVPAYTDRFNNSEDADYYQDTDPEKSNGSITNSYRVVDIGNTKYLIVTVDKYPSEAVMTWLDEGINAMTAKYPDIKIIMTMHCFITSDGGWVSHATKLIGETFWNRIKGYANLEYVICGHDYNWGPVWLKQEADDGHIVNQILVNPQGPSFDWQGASAMIAMLYFNEDTDEVQVRYYSPTVNKYYIANKNPITQATAGDKAIYALESSMFTMNQSDASVATQLTRDALKEVEYFESEVVFSAAATGSDLSINYSTDNVLFVQNGKLVIDYDATKLSNPVVENSAFDVKDYGGKVIVSWNGYNVSEKEGTLCTIKFDSTVMTGEFALVEVGAEYVGYTVDEKTYYDTSVEASGTIITTENEMIIYYESGDSFKEKVEEALAIAQYANVKLVMKADFTASSTKTIIGDVDNIPAHTVYITSEEGKSYKIDVNDKFIIFAGKFNFNNVTLGGGALNNTKNAMFFCEGSRAVFDDSISVVSTSDMTSVCGDYIEVHSGKYHYVGGAIIDGYSVTDPTVKILGNSTVARAVGGACITGDVFGTSKLEIGGSASCSYAVAGGYASEGSINDGELLVDTTGTIDRLCGAIAPCGTKDVTPNYTITVENANVTTALVGMRFLNANKTGYADIDITVNGGTYEYVYGGINVDNTSRTGTKVYGSCDITINDGKFEDFVYGAGTILGKNSAIYADTTLTIKGGTFAASVFGGANLNAENAMIYGNTTLNISSTSTTVPNLKSPTYGGSVISNSTAGYANGKTTTLNISGGTFGGALYGGSQLYAAGSHHDGDIVINIANTFDDTIYSGSFLLKADCKHNGDIEVNLSNANITGTFYGGSRMTKNTTYTSIKNGEHVGDIIVNAEGTTANDFFGGSLLESPRALHSGNCAVNIYAGSNIKGHVSGGAKFWYDGDGHRADNDTNTGIEASGNVSFKVYNTKKDGSAGAAVTMASGKRLFIAGYGTTGYKYQTMSGDVKYYINGVKLPTTAYGGLRANQTGIRTTGDIKGTLENVSFSGNFFGGSELSSASASDSGELELTLINTNVSGIVAAGSNISNAAATKTGKSTLYYKSGNVTGKILGGCYFTAAGVKIDGDSALVFGTADTAPTAAENAYVVGGSLAAEALFTGDEAANAWGMYGSSELTVKSGTIAADAYIVGGSFLKGSEAGIWANYPYVGGEANSNERQKLTIEGGTVNGPRLYAGSYCYSGGQDHGTVELEIKGGTVNLNTADKVGIQNYGKYTDAIYPATYYPVNTKAITVDHVFKFTGGKLNLYATNKTNVSGGPTGYNGTITGDTELTLNALLKNGSSTNANYRVLRIAGGLAEYGKDAKLIGDSTLNILGGFVQPSNPFTAGCYSSSVDKPDEDTGDGIANGFVQKGNVTLNINAGNISRSLAAGGYRANLDGNVLINISGGEFVRDIYGAGVSSTSKGLATAYCSVTGDIIWNISGGNINVSTSYNFFGGADASSTVCPDTGYNVIGGNIYMEISGGTITGTNVSLVGKTTLKEGKEARLKLVGDTSSVMPALASAYCTLDLTQYTGSNAIATTNFDKVYAAMNGKAVTISGLGDNSELADYVDLTGRTFIWNGSEATYSELTKFDNYSKEYKNAPVVVDATTKSGFNPSTAKLSLNCGIVYSAEFDVSTVAAEQLNKIKVNYEIVGTGIRTNSLAFRCRARLGSDFFNDHKDSYTDGFKITKLGILVSTKSALLEIGGAGVIDAWSWAEGSFNPQISGGEFATDAKYADSYLFQAAVTGYGDIATLDAERAGSKLSFRAYIVVEYENGQSSVIYLDNPVYNTQTNYVKALYDTASKIKEAANEVESSELKSWYNASAINSQTIDAIITAVNSQQKA